MLAILLSLLFPLTTSDSPDCKFGQEHFLVSGQILQTHYSQGGVESYEQNIAYPLGGITLQLVSIPADNRTPYVIGEIKTDDNGFFATELPEGSYGLVEVTEIDSLKAGQYLPMGSYSGNEWEYQRIGWSINTNGPIRVKNKDLTDLVITRSTSNVCAMCP